MTPTDTIGVSSCAIPAFSISEVSAVSLPFAVFFGMPGPMEMLIIGVIILLLFGNRLPSVMRSLGRGVVEFKKGLSGEDDGTDKVVTDEKKDSKST